MTSRIMRLAVAGLGTVGVGVVKMIQSHAELYIGRTGCDVMVTAVSARSQGKDRGVDLSPYAWETNAVDLALRDDVDVVIELIGGSEGDAYDLVKASLENGKSVVTANKALIAHHGLDLAKIADANNVSLLYEAAVAGGIPVIKSLREGFAGNEVHAVYGILNGTCNYILTEMRETGRDYADVLDDAQKLGYAEADPTFDVEGIDAAHKLAILSALAFGVEPDFNNLPVRGVSDVTAVDIDYAWELGYKIKLLGIARRTENGIEQCVEPCLVPVDSAIASVEGVFNAVYIDGDFVDTGLLIGRGAGEGPTASAVLSDILDLAREIKVPCFGLPTEKLVQGDWIDHGRIEASNYIRLVVLDKPGVIADVSAILRDYDVSIETLIQYGRSPEQPVNVVLTTHEVLQGSLQDAITKIAELDSVVEKPHVMRIEKFQ